MEGQGKQHQTASTSCVEHHRGRRLLLTPGMLHMQDALAVARQKWEGDREHEQAMLHSQKALELAELRAQMQQAQKEAELQQAVVEKRIAEQNAAELQQKMHDTEQAELRLQVRSGYCHVFMPHCVRNSTSSDKNHWKGMLGGRLLQSCNRRYRTDRRQDKAVFPRSSSLHACLGRQDCRRTDMNTTQCSAELPMAVAEQRTCGKLLTCEACYV